MTPSSSVRTCPICGEQFSVVARFGGGSNRQKYCDDECAKAAAKRRPHHRSNPRPGRETDTVSPLGNKWIIRLPNGDLVTERR